MNKFSISAFLISFNDLNNITNAINCIYNQTEKPTQFLIVDNSFSDTISSYCHNNNINCYKVGFNSGPAGGASIALELLAKSNPNWIYWGDDGDPPVDPDTFKKLLEIAYENPSAGVIGKLGGKFISYRARTRVFGNSELSPIVEADYVTGGKQMIVSADVVKAGILPDPKLFFGFEELEFCLRVKDAGFKILVDGDGISEARHKAGNFDKTYRWKGKSMGDFSRVNRQYYSVRNMLYILWSRGHYFGYGFFLLKNLIKIPVSIRYGTSYFIKFSKLTLIAIYHQWIGRYGQYIPTR